MLQKQGRYCYKHLHQAIKNLSRILKGVVFGDPPMNFCLQPKSKLKFLPTSSPNIFGNWKYIHPWKHRRSRKCMQRFAKKNGKTFYLFQLTSGSRCCKKDSQAINYFKLCIARLGVLSCVLNIDFATSNRVCACRGQKLLPTTNTE